MAAAVLAGIVDPVGHGPEAGDRERAVAAVAEDGRAEVAHVLVAGRVEGERVVRSARVDELVAGGEGYRDRDLGRGGFRDGHGSEIGGNGAGRAVLIFQGGGEGHRRSGRSGG